MKSYILFLQFLTIFIGCNCRSADYSRKNRKWLEIDNNLYRIETEDKYTWQAAKDECIKEHTNLLVPKSDQDYVKLKEALKHEIKTDSSFWINAKEKDINVLEQMGLAEKKMCSKMDNSVKNSSTFTAGMINCQDRLGFICQRSFLKEFSTFINGTYTYLVQPHQKFSCQQAFSECKQRQMDLLHFDNYTNNILKNYIFLNYNSNTRFHLNGTNQNCNSVPSGKNKDQKGFICEKLYVKTSGLTMRHKILILFVSSIIILVICVKIIMFLYKHVYKRFINFRHYNLSKS